MKITESWWWKLLKWLLDTVFKKAIKKNDSGLQDQITSLNNVLDAFKEKLATIMEEEDEEKRLRKLAALAAGKRIR